jgi:hypothetical protein
MDSNKKLLGTGVKNSRTQGFKNSREIKNNSLVPNFASAIPSPRVLESCLFDAQILLTFFEVR